MDEGEYAAWNKRKEEVKLALVDREARIAEVDGEIEKELDIIGSTAIEDRLQDEVA